MAKGETAEQAEVHPLPVRGAVQPAVVDEDADRRQGAKPFDAREPCTGLCRRRRSGHLRGAAPAGSSQETGSPHPRPAQARGILPGNVPDQPRELPRRASDPVDSPPASAADKVVRGSFHSGATGSKYGKLRSFGGLASVWVTMWIRHLG